MGYDVVEAESFWDCVASMSKDDAFHADLMRTMLELRSDPFKSPKLSTHSVGKAKNGKVVFSSDVGGRSSDRRLVWQAINQTVVILLYGTHAVQDRAKRMSIDFDASQRVVTIYEQAPDTGDSRPYQEQRLEIGKAFMAWTDEELADFGFGPLVVQRLRRLEDRDALLELADDLSEADFEKAFNLLAFGHPDGEAGAAEQREAEPETVVEVEPPTPTEDDVELEKQLQDPYAGAWFTRMEPEQLEALLAAPIEDWMLFLHPDQRSVVQRNYSGPARVRGSAGTGKTVVVLHRAAELARRYDPNATDDGGRILVTTFIKSLPPVLEHLYKRLPDARPHLVRFINIDKLAYEVCKEAHQAPTIDPRGVEAACSAAWKQVITPDSPLRRLGVTEQYANEEVTWVIKGRGIAELDSYLNAKRTGRKLQLSESAKRQMWDFHLAWEDGLEKRGIQDFADIILRARDIARARTTPTFRAALIDEAQDLTLAGLQLIRALVNGPEGDRTDGLFLAGDGAQRIYPGGFTLRQAGVQVRGRTTVLKLNYRNTAEILAVAMATTGAESVEDLDEQFTRQEDAGDTQRHGPRPQLLMTDGEAQQYELVAQRITATVENKSNGIDSGDIAVLCPSNKIAKAVRAALRDHHIPTLDLNDYDGVPSSSVKVGTHHRVKGLEFKAVILTDLSDGVFPRPKPSYVTAEEWADQEATALAALFVAMTRARDQLTLTCVAHPSALLEGAFDRLDLVDAGATV